MNILKAIVVLSMLTSFAGRALASDSTCDSALVQSSIDSQDYTSLDYRAASLLTSEEWATLQQSGGVNGQYAGVTLGTSYSDFQNNVSSAYQSWNQSVDKVVSRNILWVGLSDTSRLAYDNCLKTQVLLSNGTVHMAVNSATQSDITLIITYSLVGHNPSSVPLTWDYSKLPKGIATTVYTGAQLIVKVPRPDVEESIVVNAAAYGSDSVTLSPVPPKEEPKINPAPPLPTTLAVYRFRDNSPFVSKGYFFALSMAEGLSRKLTFEKIAFRVLAASEPGSVNLYQCQVDGSDFAGSAGGNSCPASIETTISQIGYAYAPGAQKNNAVKLAYCWNQSRSWHLLSIDPVNECAAQGATVQVYPYAWVFPP